jgi:hypothetical protein
MLERRTASNNRALQDAIQIAAKQESQRAKQQDTKRSTERLGEQRDSRKVIGLLEKIANRLENLDRGGGLGNAAGSVLSGAALGRLLARSNARSAARAKLVRDASGRWRNTVTGRYSKAPPPGFFQRIANGVGESRIGRLGGAVARSPLGRMAGAAARSPLGRIAGQGLRLGGNVLGKLAWPVAIGMSIFDGVNGMRNADNILGRKTNGTEKAQVGMAQAVNGFLLGLPDFLSKKVFGQSFAKLMVDGLGDVQKQLTNKINGIWDGTRKMIGAGFGTVANVYNKSLSAMTKYGDEIAAAGAGLIAAVKAKDMKGAVSALGKLGALLFKPTAAIAAKADQLVQAGGKAVAQGVRSGGAAVATSVSAGISAVAGWAGLGSTSAKYESGNRGVMAISSGKGDPGGASYGKYQLASKTGTLQRYLKDSGYDKQFAGLAPGSKEFNAKWRELGKSDPKFAESQHDFIKKTHYDPAAKYAASLGFNMNNRGMQDAVWSASVQHGGVKRLLAMAAATPGWAQMSDEQKLRTFYSVRAQYATNAMRRNKASASQIASVQKRYQSEVNDALALSRNGSDVQMASTSAVPSNMKVASSMAAARGSASRASMSPVSEPLTQELPVVPVNKPDMQKPLNDLKALYAASKEPAQTKVAANTGGTGGLPSVGDVADRPRIDLQAITTTLAGRG